MHTIVVVLICLASFNRAARVQSSLGASEGSLRDISKESRSLSSTAVRSASSADAEHHFALPETVKAFATMLLALNPASAFQPNAVEATGLARGGRSDALANRQPRGLAGVGRGRRQSPLTMAVQEETIDIPPPTSYEDPTKLEFRKLALFFGRVTVGLGPGMKPFAENFDASWKDDTSAVAPVLVKLPMGIVFEESETVPGRFEVIEVQEGSNGENAGIKVGDLIRATTAMAVNMMTERESVSNALGMTKPGMQRAFFNADRQPFDELMKAFTSNAESAGGPGEATLVIERNNPFGDKAKS